MSCQKRMEGSVMFYDSSASTATCMHDSCVYIVSLIVYGVTTYPAPEQGSGLLGQEQGEALGYVTKTGKPL